MPPKRVTGKKTPTKVGGNKRTSIQTDVQEDTGGGGSRLQNPQNVAGKVKVAKCATNARAEVEKWARRALDKGVNGLREEFAELRRYAPADMKVDTFVANWDAGRNRYKDVPCQEKFRVVLKWPNQQHDYIHANYVSTPISEKRFICTQGPLDCTITDFWHMVIQEESDSLIMLCNTKEKGMEKCAQYWPLEEKEVQKYGDVEVGNLAVRPLTVDEPNIRVSTLCVRWMNGNDRKERVIRHYQYLDWPDRGVPSTRLTVMVLLSYVRGTTKPIVVHCSAGIGRTGSIVAIEFILERMQSGIPCEAMDEILKELRNQRPYSIQNDLSYSDPSCLQQYLYVHRIILFYFIEKYRVGSESEEIQNKYKKFIEEYDKATA
ncbi:hypothetical protein M3Y95_00015700 [Aphelenchoides besseyi]|nr:hypothetical protein M3Y95_00015700 [Aphelenchoides besseyi]